MNFRILVLIIILTLFYNYSSSQTQSLIASLRDPALVDANEHERLERYVKELKLYDITLTVPDTMKAVDMKGNEYICNNISKGWTNAMPGNDVCKVAMKTGSGDAVFLMPNLLYAWPKNALRTAYCVRSELTMNHKDPDLDVSEHVKIISNTDNRKYSGADTVIIYNFEFEVPFLDNYRHCIGVYMRSYAHNALPLKIALTDNGLKNADKYIDALLNMIEIGKNPHPDFIKAEEDTQGEKDIL